MTPESPVVEGLEPYEVILGGDQPEYLPLPALRSAGPHYAILTRWVPTEEERRQVAEGADIYLTVWTFGKLYPPTALEVAYRSTNPEPIKAGMELDRELNERLRILFTAGAAQTVSPGGESE